MNYSKLKNDIFKILLEVFIFDKKYRSKLKARIAKQYLKKYVDYAAENYTISSEGDSQIIWQYWHQGKENAPELIQKCLESVQKHESDKEIKVLSFDTIKYYVELPDIYYELVKSGKMKIALFSDILRLYLLKKYGGCWVDSTIYLTDKIPQEVWESDFFVFQKNPKTDMQENKMSCFFIRAKNHSANIAAIKCALEKYWAENDFIVNYFMFEHISTMLSDTKDEILQEWEKMPLFSAEKTGLLQKIMFENFDENYWETLKKETSVHKLTYKNINTQQNENSYYNYIITKGDKK